MNNKKALKHGIMAFLFVFICMHTAKAQADKIVGYWLTACGRSQIYIFKGDDGKYHGKIAWLKNKKDREQLDVNNPDKHLRHKKILGLQMLNGFQYNKKEKEWSGGKAYDPETGNYYDAYIWLDDEKDVLFLKGYVAGMRFLGRKTKWKREYYQRKD